jgi:predicted fused transcriptional regulator/phosphomethylpyrimidine kinase
MTYFTKCLETSFTLTRWFDQLGESKDAVEDDGSGGAESAVRGSGDSAGEVADGVM